MLSIFDWLVLPALAGIHPLYLNICIITYNHFYRFSTVSVNKIRFILSLISNFWSNISSCRGRSLHKENVICNRNQIASVVGCGFYHYISLVLFTDTCDKIDLASVTWISFCGRFSGFLLRVYIVFYFLSMVQLKFLYRIRENNLCMYRFWSIINSCLYNIIANPQFYCK